MPILGSSSSAANKDRMSKIWKKWGSITQLSRKQCGKRKKLLIMSNLSFPHNVFKSSRVLMRQNEYLWSKGLNLASFNIGHIPFATPSTTNMF